MEKVEIKGIVAKPGEKAFGFLDVGTTSITTYRIPLAILNGVERGKTLAILGGTHGTEFASIEAVIRTIQDLDPKKMKGTVLAVPVLNGPQFEFRAAFLSPIDQLNQNRVFPGDPEGTLSQRTAHVVFSEIVSKSDALLDCHGGDIGENIDCMVIARQGEDEKINRIAREMAACFPTKYISSFPSSARGMTTTAQDEFGIPCVISEAGTPYPILERHIQFHYEGIRNNLKYFGILEGKPKMSTPAVSPKRYSFKAKQGGIWHPKVDIGQSVSTGEELGNMTDLFGNILETYTAPENATVTSMRVFYSVNCGEQLIGLVVLG